MIRKLPLALATVGIACSISAGNGLSAQNNPACPNANFNQQDFTGWDLAHGTMPGSGVLTLNPWFNSGPGQSFVINNNQVQHSVTPGGNDLPASGPIGNFDVVVNTSQLQSFPPGTNSAVRLGNRQTGARAEGLRYSYVVGPQSELFTYRFAVVFQDPNHSVQQQPRFDLAVYDQSNNLVPCTQYIVTAAGNIPGFQSQGQIRWRQWTAVGVDLSPYSGQNVSIIARTGDCTLSGHYGYGYLWADCSPLQIDIAYCVGDNVAILAAPDGFSSYVWSDQNGNVIGNTKDININNPQNGAAYSVVITSVLGCQATLTAILQPTIVTAAFADVDLCQGVIQFTDNTNVVNGTITNWEYNFGDGNNSTGVQNPSHQYAANGTYNVELIAISPAGCRDTIQQQISVAPVIDADFSLPDPCGLNISFNDLSTINNPGTLNSWSWNFGTPGGTGTGQNPTFNYTAPGTYNVELIAGSTDNCFDTIVKPITIFSIPTANFTGGPECAGNPMVFVDLSTNVGGPITDWQWNFGSGAATSTQQNPLFPYPTHGNYNATLIVTGPGGCKDTLVQAVTVHPTPVASFVPPGPCGLTQLFNDGSTIGGGGTINQWVWTFDQVGSSTQQNPTFTFPAPGTYDVNLLVTSPQGCSSNITLPYTTVGDLNANFTHLNVCLGNPLPFTDATTIQADNLVQWNWNFGNGSSGSGANTSHVYNADGTFNVQLAVLTQAGCVDTVIIPVTVHPLPQISFAADSICAGQSMAIQNNTTINNPGTISTWLWDFGGIVPPTGQNNPSINWPSWGTYTVSLTATSNEGCVSSGTRTVRVNARPVLDFGAQPLEGCQPLKINTINNTSAPDGSAVTTYNWNFGDGSNLPGQLPAHVYLQHGVFSITLTATTEHGCDTTATLFDYITVFPKPNAQFNFTNISDFCIGESFGANNFSNVVAPGSISNNFWTISGPGFISNTGDENLAPTTLPLTGSYNVRLVITTTDGCTDTLIRPIQIYELPEPDFSSTTDCFWENTFEAFVQGGETPYQYQWDMGDDGVVNHTVPNVLHIWGETVSGNMPVKLTVIDANGCRKDTIKEADVKPAPQLEMPNVLALNPEHNGNDRLDFEQFAPEFNICVDYTLYIYNRWGNLVFETDNLKDMPDLTCQRCWQGLGSGGQELTDGVYYYVLKGIRGFERKGFIHLFNQ